MFIQERVVGDRERLRALARGERDAEQKDRLLSVLHAAEVAHCGDVAAFVLQDPPGISAFAAASAAARRAAAGVVAVELDEEFVDAAAATGGVAWAPDVFAGEVGGVAAGAEEGELGFFEAGRGVLGVGLVADAELGPGEELVGGLLRGLAKQQDRFECEHLWARNAASQRCAHVAPREYVWDCKTGNIASHDAAHEFLSIFPDGAAEALPRLAQRRQ
jgi:hypothetical protein